MTQGILEALPRRSVMLRYPSLSFEKHPAAYEALIPRDSPGPLTFTKKGSLAELTFEGQMKDGTKLRMTATCRQVDEI